MTDIINYLLAIMADGDYLNDWLTHLPHIVQPFVLFLGYLLSIILGF